jgi:hypothetical protein
MMLHFRKLVSFGLTTVLVACTDKSLIGTTEAGATASVPSIVTQTLNSCGVATTGSPSVQTIDVPNALTGDNWGDKAQSCQQGGWDLTLCAGKPATFTTFGSGKTDSAGQPMTIYVASVANAVCCIYGETNANGGGYPVLCNADAGAAAY